MEMGCAGAVILGFPFKKASDGDDLVKPIVAALKKTFPGLPGSDVDEFRLAVTELQEARRKCCTKFDRFPEKNDLLTQLTQYYDTLCVLEKKLDSCFLEVALKWDDAFDEGSYFRRTRATVGSSLGFEKLCVLFNVAAAQSQIASSFKCETDDQLQAAAKSLQQAGSILQEVKSGIPEACEEPTPDLTQETLSALALLMPAQMQEVIVLKAIRDQKKPASIAKLCVACASMYAEAYSMLNAEAVKYMFPRAALVTSGKHDAYQGIGEYFQALACQQQKKFGEGVARLQKALELLKSGAAKSGYEFPENLRIFSETIDSALHAAVKDNDVIYVEAVPSYSKCEPISGIRLAKISPFPGMFSTDFVTSFDAFADYEDTEEKRLNREASLSDEEAASRRGEATRIKLEANQMFLKEEYSSAVAAFDSALKVCPARFTEDRAILYQNRGACKAHQDKLGAALVDLNRALELNSMYLKARLKRAQVLEKLHMGPQALEDYNMIIAMDPEHKESLDAVERLKA